MPRHRTSFQPAKCGFWTYSLLQGKASFLTPMRFFAVSCKRNAEFLRRRFSETSHEKFGKIQVCAALSHRATNFFRFFRIFSGIPGGIALATGLGFFQRFRFSAYFFAAFRAEVNFFAVYTRCKLLILFVPFSRRGLILSSTRLIFNKFTLVHRDRRDFWDTFGTRFWE